MPKRRPGRKRNPAVSLPKIQLKGDHGPNTPAARAGKALEPITDDQGRNPNNMGRMRREDVLERLSLTLRQRQAANAIRDAYCRVEMLSSGAALREQVDNSPRPDAAIAAQIDAQSQLVHVMRPIGRTQRSLVEWICWHNRPGRRSGEARWSERFKAEMDKVADHMRY